MWQNRDFRKLFTANLVSSFGSQITLLALPLTAISLLQATPLQLGILATCGTLPYLLLSLPAGAMVDRLRRRPILVACDVGRAAILSGVPLLVLLGWLRIEHLYLAAFLTGTFSMIYDISEESYLPSVIAEKELVQGNSQLAAIDASAEMAAPLFAGGLVQVLTAPFAVLVDALSFLWSALWIGRIRKQEAKPAPAPRAHFWREVREGLGYLLRHPLLRPPLLTGLQWQFFGGMKDALLILFLVDTLNLPPVAFGLVYAVGSFSGLVATRFSPRLTEKFGPGPVVIGAALILGIGWLFLPLAGGGPWAAFGIISLGMLLAGAGNMTWNVTTASLTQTITPNRLLGRVNASDRFITWGALPLGSLVGGWLAQQTDVRTAMLLAGVGVCLGVLWVWFSPLRRLRKFPKEG